MRLLFIVFAAALCCGAQAAVPPPVATLDRASWPERLSSPALFDVASRAEILSFAHELLLSEALDGPALAERLGLRQVNLEQVNALRLKLWQRLWENFDHAQKSCEQDASFCYAVDDLPMLRQEALAFKVEDDSFYTHWAEPARAFNRTYLDELLRMAALFPQISSEIERFSEIEHNGDELNDRVFLLTFDGGPTLAQGQTDWVTDYLRRQRLTATFFTLGNSVQLRRDNAPQDDLEALYRDQCVGVQGWQYRSHSQWVDWQQSVQRSVALVQSQVPDNYVPLFRPPYGQRRADSQGFFEAQQLQVMLWDIDSMDNNVAVSAAQAADRVISLMLLWRKGVIVFHDTQDKVKNALPAVFEQTLESGIGWEECREFPPLMD